MRGIFIYSPVAPHLHAAVLMARSLPVVLPLSGDVSLHQVTAALRTAPRGVGTGREAEVRSVRLTGRGRQYHVGTLLCAGRQIDAGAPERVSLAGGALLLLRRVVRLAELRSPARLKSLLSVWPGVPPDEAGEWQENLHVSRISSEPEWGVLPYWSVNLPRRDTPSMPFSAPPDPYFDPASSFFAETLEVAAAKWLQDPSGHERWDTHGTTRVVLFDCRAYFTEVKADARRIHIRTTSAADAPLVCWAQIVDFGGSRTEHRVDFAGGETTLEAPGTVQSFDLRLFTSAGEYRDRYVSRTGGLWAFGRRRQAVRRFTASQEALLADAASGETLHVELKAWIPPESHDKKNAEFLKAVCAFANADGGRLYIGVEDDGEISGVDQPLKRAYDKDTRGDTELAREMYVRQLRDIVRQGMEPGFDAVFTWIEYAGRFVLCVGVERGQGQPYQVISTREFFIRKNGRSLLALRHELEAMYLARNGHNRT